MQKVAYTFLGSGAARYIGLGFVPDRVQIRNVEAAAAGVIDWDERMRTYATTADGIYHAISTGAWTGVALTVGQGVTPYYGGDVITAAAATHIVPAVGFSSTYSGTMVDKGTLGTVNTWTLDTAGSHTGHFNVGVSTTYVGVGSYVLIRGTDDLVRKYRIVALTNDGDAANEVTLDRDAASGTVTFISYMFDLVNAPVGTVMPAGIYLADTTLNASNESCMITAECD